MWKIPGTWTLESRGHWRWAWSKCWNTRAAPKCPGGHYICCFRAMILYEYKDNLLAVKRGVSAHQICTHSTCESPQMSEDRRWHRGAKSWSNECDVIIHLTEVLLTDWRYQSCSPDWSNGWRLIKIWFAPKEYLESFPTVEGYDGRE